MELMDSIEMFEMIGKLGFYTENTARLLFI